MHQALQGALQAAQLGIQLLWRGVYHRPAQVHQRHTHIPLLGGRQRACSTYEPGSAQAARWTDISAEHNAKTCSTPNRLRSGPFGRAVMHHEHDNVSLNGWLKTPA